MKRWSRIISVLLFTFYSGICIHGQDIAPQLWSNAFVGYEINDQLVLRNNVSFNYLFSDDFPWNEIAFSTGIGYKFHQYLEGSGGLYLSRVKQSFTLSSFEVRLIAGFRAFSNNQKRYFVSNLSRLEWRHFNYSDATTASTGRFRNLTFISYSLTQHSMLSDKNLFLFGYIEAFYNFNDATRERFFNIMKFNLGLGYRLSYNWRFNLGMVYQDSKNNVKTPTHYPTILTTNYVIEWSVVYFINKRGED